MPQASLQWCDLTTYYRLFTFIFKDKHTFQSLNPSSNLSKLCNVCIYYISGLIVPLVYFSWTNFYLLSSRILLIYSVCIHCCMFQHMLLVWGLNLYCSYWSLTYSNIPVKWPQSKCLSKVLQLSFFIVDLYSNFPSPWIILAILCTNQKSLHSFCNKGTKLEQHNQSEPHLS